MEDLCTPVAGSNKIAAYSLPLANPFLFTDALLNDSDKTIIIPSGEIWEIFYIRCFLISCATAGNRLVEIHVSDSAPVVHYGTFAGATQPANLQSNYMFFPSAPFQSSFFHSRYLFCPFPKISLPPLSQIRIFDSNAIAPSSDDLKIFINYNKIEI